MNKFLFNVFMVFIALIFFVPFSRVLTHDIQCVLYTAHVSGTGFMYRTM